jgi:hypothetical protein
MDIENVAKMAFQPPPLPPHSVEVEAAVLGVLLSSPAIAGADIARCGINRNSFYDLRHRVIYEAIKATCDEGKVPDLITVAQRLSAEGRAEEVGGYGYLMGLPDNVVYLLDQYVEKLHDLRTRRDVLKQLSTIEARAYDLLEPFETLKGDLDAALALSATNRKDLPPIQDGASFVRHKIVPPRELVYGLLHEGSKLVLGGGSKTFKTWTLLDLGLSVAYGEPWLSFKTGRGKVLYVNFELPDFSFQNRLLNIAKSKGIDLSQPQIDFWHLRGQAASYSVLFPKIAERVKSSGYSLIILDPIYKCYGGTDENSAGEVATMLNAIEKLTVETGAAVAFGAHYAKGNAASKEAIDRISGSGVFARDPDTILSFTRHETADAFTVEATLRNFKPIEPFVVRWIYPLMRVDEDLDPKRLKQLGGRPKEREAKDIVALLKTPLTIAEWKQAAAEQLGIGHAVFFRMKRKALEAGLIVESPDGKWCRSGRSQSISISINGDTDSDTSTDTITE